MSVAYYMDEHFPGPVIHGLRSRGVEVLTSQDDRRDGLDDEALLDRVTELHHVLCTQDQDFFAIAANRQRLMHSFAGILFLPQGKLSYREAIDELEIIAKCCEWDEWTSQIHYLPIIAN
jgi:hypothetical protein